MPRERARVTPFSVDTPLLLLLLLLCVFVLQWYASSDGSNHLTPRDDERTGDLGL